jgi:competence protein ComEC
MRAGAASSGAASSGASEPTAAGWPRRAAAAWIVGIIVGELLAWPRVWIIFALAGVIAAWWVAPPRPVWRWVALLAWAALGAAWLHVQRPDASAATLARYLMPDGALAEVEGTVVAEPQLVEGTTGPFAAFGYEAPATRFEFKVNRITTNEGPEPVAGRLVVRLDVADHRLRLGQRLRLRGWLAPIGGPLNPGDFDFRQYMTEQGVVGRLGLANRGNVEVLAEPGLGDRLWGPASWVVQLRQEAAARAAWALGLGMGDDPVTLGLLQTLLLGQTTHDIDPLAERFRDVGLAHILSISGAHLGILMGLVWLVAKLLVDRPNRAAVIVLAVLGLYLLAVPLRVPIVRASVMAGLYFLGMASGRRPDATNTMALAALLLLIVRPSDVFEPGFQLSFVVVFALLRFTRTVSQAFWPDPEVELVNPGDGRGRWGRWAADLAAGSVVATATALPLVAFHFGMVNPLAVVLSVLALPVLTAVLGLGYLKILCGMAWPSVALVLGGPLAWMGRTLIALVQEAATWPGATVRLSQPVPWVWAAATLGVVWWWFAGGFARRRSAGVAAVLVLAGWVSVNESATLGPVWRGEPDAWARPAATLSMIAVGDGSCFVVRSGGRTLVFDCGSQPYPLIGRRSVVPTLRRLGVRRIDVLVISHADLDHYNGVPDLVREVPTAEVWVSSDVLDDAAANPTRATAALVQGLRDDGLPLRTVHRGQRFTLGDASLEVLWPPAEGWDAARGNDRSVVLKIDVAGRRLLLNGDVQQDALTQLLQTPDALDADVTDLPHHGSFVEASERWIDAVTPAVVLQSSGPARLRRDRWRQPLAQRGVPRRVSDRDGFTEVRVGPDGTLAWSSFLDRANPSAVAE